MAMKEGKRPTKANGLGLKTYFLQNDSCRFFGKSGKSTLWTNTSQD